MLKKVETLFNILFKKMKSTLVILFVPPNSIQLQKNNFKGIFVKKILSWIKRLKLKLENL